MQNRQPRLILAGSVLVGFAIAFALAMFMIAPQSSDPAKLMGIVGQTAGTLIGVGVAVMVVGVIKRRQLRG